MIKVLLVDDHTLFRDAIKYILSHTSDITVADEAANASKAIDSIRRNDYDVVISEISLPGKSGLDFLKELETMTPKNNVLILTMHSEKDFAVKTMKLGASGFLAKDSNSAELIKAIYRVAAGYKYMSPYLAEQLATEIGGELPEYPHNILSNREYEIMTMIATGKAVKEIATELSLSTSTVSTIRGRILEKMKMRNNAEIMRYAINEKLVS